MAGKPGKSGGKRPNSGRKMAYRILVIDGNALVVQKVSRQRWDATFKFKIASNWEKLEDEAFAVGGTEDGFYKCPKGLSDKAVWQGD